jgi:hypothetical protein
MRVILWLLVIVLFTAGIGIAFVPFLVPEAASALDPIICPGNPVVRIHSEPSYDGGTSMSFRCVNDAGDETDASPLIYFILFTAWGWLPLIPFLLLAATGGIKFRSNLSGGDRRTIILPQTGAFGGAGSGTTLKDKLQLL